MHDIWNPWHGCRKVSEGCQNCYMFSLDRLRHRDGADIYRTRTGFRAPVQRDRRGAYKIQSGELIRVCMTSDFFLEEADPWREEAWAMMQERSDVRFFLLTKRPERVRDCLPAHWGDGWENIFFNVSCENQARADERIPVLLRLPFRHKGIMAAPLIGPLELDPYLESGQIEQIIAGGENYDGSRPCDFHWIRSLRESCQRHRVSFSFIETGTRFIKDGRSYHLPTKQIQSEMAWKSAMSCPGRPIHFILRDGLGRPLEPEELYVPHYRSRCERCGSRPICNGCSDCGRC